MAAHLGAGMCRFRVDDIIAAFNPRIRNIPEFP